MIDGKKVRALRAEHGYSLRVLAARMEDIGGFGISHETIRRVEAGEFDLGTTKAVVLANALGVSLNDIIHEHAAA